jgi:pyrroline-5-carboxylate reductase
MAKVHFIGAGQMAEAIIRASLSNGVLQETRSRWRISTARESTLCTPVIGCRATVA